jgi:hypothetical protein
MNGMAVRVGISRMPYGKGEVMIRVKGLYHNQTLDLDRPLNLADGTEVEVEIYTPEEAARQDWAELGMSRLEAEWDNPTDAIYDDWKKLYGV